ncbi:hypothetical protein U1Q18_032012 [Sarracenia purpurea var. burkii]
MNTAPSSSEIPVTPARFTDPVTVTAFSLLEASLTVEAPAPTPMRTDPKTPLFGIKQFLFLCADFSPEVSSIIFRDFTNKPPKYLDTD